MQREHDPGHPTPRSFPSFVPLAQTHSVMPDPLLVNTDYGEDIVPTTPTSNHCPLLHLPTELLVEIIVTLNTDYLKEPPGTSYPLPALRL